MLGLWESRVADFQDRLGWKFGDLLLILLFCWWWFRLWAKPDGCSWKHGGRWWCAWGTWSLRVWSCCFSSSCRSSWGARCPVRSWSAAKCRSRCDSTCADTAASLSVAPWISAAVSNCICRFSPCRSCVPPTRCRSCWLRTSAKSSGGTSWVATGGPPGGRWAAASRINRWSPCLQSWSASPPQSTCRWCSRPVWAGLFAETVSFRRKCWGLLSVAIVPRFYSGWFPAV